MADPPKLGKKLRMSIVTNGIVVVLALIAVFIVALMEGLNAGILYTQEIER